MQLPSQVQRFRHTYRQKIGPYYNGLAHFLFTSVGSLAAIAVSLWYLDDVRAAEWLTIPGTWLLANLIEYLAHRGPMHHLAPGLRLLYERHARQHHRFYTHEAMPCESARDFKMILFPPVMLLFFLGCIAFPIGGLLYWLASENIGLLFAATAMSYFLTYEWLHLGYHLDPDSWVGRLPFMQILRRHHTAHHNPRLMGRWNFNITFPICDRLLGTYYCPQPTVAASIPPSRQACEQPPGQPPR